MARLLDAFAARVFEDDLLTDDERRRVCLQLAYSAHRCCSSLLADEMQLRAAAHVLDHPTASDDDRRETYQYLLNSYQYLSTNIGGNLAHLERFVPWFEALVPQREWRCENRHVCGGAE